MPKTPPKCHSQTASGLGRSAVLVDFGGVLTKPLGPAFTQVCRNHLVDPGGFLAECLGDYASEGAPIALFERGLIDETEFARRVAPLLERHASGPVDAQAWLEEVFGRLGNVDEAMAAGIAELAAKGIYVVLLSNSWGGRARYPWQLLPSFTDIVLSEEVGLRKPDPRIYLHAASLIGVQATDCVMIDDIELNITAAERLGMAGIHLQDSADTLTRLALMLDGTASTAVDVATEPEVP